MFHGHPKVMELSPSAVGIWTLTGSWAASYLTDGQVQGTIAKRFGATDGDIQELVNSGLWDEVTPGKYQFKDWDHYQPIKEEVEAERAEARERMRAVRAKKKGTKGSGERSDVVQPNTSRTSEEVRVTPSLPVPSRKEPSSPATPSKGFTEFWTEYPKKVAKQPAIKAWNKAAETSDPQQIIDGAKKYAQLMIKDKVEKKFVKSPDGWLNAGRWDDELPDTNTTTKHNPLWD